VSEPGDYKGMERGRWLTGTVLDPFVCSTGSVHGSVGPAACFFYVHPAIEPDCDRPIGPMLLPPPLSTP
jgi:hypothetical protein